MSFLKLRRINVILRSRLSASGEQPGIWGTETESTPGAHPIAGARSRVDARLLARLVLGLSLAAAALLQSLFYLSLPYRSSWIVATTLDEAATVPSPDFRLGSIEWSVSAYSVEPSLEPFRTAFRNTCGEKRGLPAALCVAEAISRQFPYGSPATEFTDRKFDPVGHMQRHAAGDAGHCMNRVAIVAAQLLSVGIPARVTQLFPGAGRGHNVVEVWGEPDGWVMVDPSYGSPNRPDIRLYKGRVLYPEPWLYLRVGARSAPWPFRGAFACLGASALECGGTHDLLRLGIFASGLASVGFLVGALRARSRRPGNVPS